jgi:hypothetical protein
MERTKPISGDRPKASWTTATMTKATRVIVTKAPPMYSTINLTSAAAGQCMQLPPAVSSAKKPLAQAEQRSPA